MAIGGDYSKLSDDEVAALQTFLDPVGFQGLGYGKAPAGAWVDVSTGELLPINITATIDYAPNTDTDAVYNEFVAAVTEYIQSRVFEVDPVTKELYPIGYNKVASLLGSVSGVDNFHDLTINGGTTDIALQFFDIPTLGTVTLNG